MGDGGVACVASHVMEHFSASEPYCGERSGSGNNIRGFDTNSNSVQFEDRAARSNDSEGDKEGCAGTAAFGEHAERAKRSSRWDVVQDNDASRRSKETGLGLGLGLGVELGMHRHDGVQKPDERHGSSAENKLRSALENSGKHHLGSQTEKFPFDMRGGGSKSRRLSDGSQSRSGYFETSLSRNSADRHEGHYKTSHSSRIVYDRHSRHELPSSRSSYDRHSRRSGSIDRGYSERSSYDRRWQYEERNGYRKSSAEKLYSRCGSHGYEDRQFHRDAVSRDARRHSSWRQSHSRWSNQIPDENRGRFSNSCGSHSRSSYCGLTKDLRSKDAELDASPSRTPAWEQSERFPDDSQSEFDSNCFTGPGMISEEICGQEKPRCRGWCYIDQVGIEQGPMKLEDLKRLVEDGLLQSDHLVKREGSDEWVTVENAASPMPFGNLSRSTSKFSSQGQINQLCENSINKVVAIPEDCKNIQDITSWDNQGRNDSDLKHSTVLVKRDDSDACQVSDIVEDFHIDERVERLMQGFTLIQGRENEIVSEALCHAARYVNRDMEHNVESEGSPGLHDGFGKYCSHWRDVELGRGFGSLTNESNVSSMAVRSGIPIEKESDYDKDVSTAMGISYGAEGITQFAGRWPSKGGDWKRIGEFDNCSRIQNVGACERLLKKKIVLNDGAPLCQVWKSGALDPRKQLQEVYSHSVQCKRLELPPWAYRLHEDKSDHLYKVDNLLEGHMQLGQSSIATPKAHTSTPRSQVSTPISQISTPRGCLAGNKLSQQKSSTMKCSNVIKTASSLHCEMKPVLKRNAEVFRNYGLSAWDPCAKNQYLECNIVKTEEVADQPLHQQEMGNRCDLPAEGLNVLSPRVHVPDLQGMAEVEAVQLNEKILSGYVITVNDLKLHLGEWYYRDGAGYEKGPLTFAQLEALVSDGTLQKGSSVYRKSDSTWVPVSRHAPLIELLPCSSNSEMINPAICGTSQNMIATGGQLENLKQQCQQSQLEEGPADLASTFHPGILHTSHEQRVKDSLCQHPGTASPVCSFPEQYKLEDCSTNQVTCSFHELYPQYIGYARGKLHEHVMKFYRSRDFLAAINEGLDAWMAPEQSKRCTEMRMASPVRALRSSAAGIAVTFNHVDENHNSQKSEVRGDEILNNLMTDQQGIDHMFSHAEFEKNGTQNKLETELEDNIGHNKHHYVSKRRRLQLIQEGDRGGSTRKELEAGAEVGRSHGVLEGEAARCLGNDSCTQNKIHCWGMMDFRILERIFHFLGSDLKSLAFSAATCKRWNKAIQNLKNKSRRIDLSFMGPDCTDGIFRSIMGGYGEGKIKYVVLRGCTNVSADALVQFLRACSYVISVDITGCNQFKEVIRVFPNVKWLRNHITGPSSSGDLSEEAHCKVKSLKQINDKSYGTTCKPSRGLDIHLSDDSAGKDTFMSPAEADQGEPMEVDDFQVDSKASVSPPHQHIHSVKRVKLSNSGKSAKVNLEDVSVKGEASAKSSTGHPAGGDKSIEKHLVVALKAIMGVNTSNFFSHEASEIEGKIKDGGYSGCIYGINSFKDDIFLICRKAFQEHKKGSPAHAAAENMFKTTHRLVSILEKKFSKCPAYGSDVILRAGKDKSQSSFYPSGLSLNKRHARGMKVGAKGIKRRRGKYYSDCSVDTEEYGSDREGRRLSKLKRRHWQDSETETSESSDFVEEEYLEKEDDKNDVEDSDPDMKFEFEGENGGFGEDTDVLEEGGFYSEISAREWGARMTKVSFVPPVPRKYEVIDEYIVVADEEQVRRKMKVCLPDDYDEKLRAAKERINGDYAHLEIPELKEYKPRKQLGSEVLEQEVYGIDPYTHNLLLDTMPKGSDYSLQQQHLIIEEVLLRALNQKVRSFTGTGKAPMEYPLQNVVQKMQKDAEKAGDSCMQSFCQGLLKAMQSRQPSEKYVAYRKGLGVVCNKEGGFEKDDFVVEFLGEVYPAWRWHEKQDAIRSLQNGIRSLQKKDKDPAPEFYNINLERPKGDGAGYDLVVVDAMHKANYASRICHSCRPNCEAKVTAVGGQYQIGVYTVRPIQYGEEITFDYNSLTESKEEYEASVCLCGSQGCRGSYLNLACAGPYQKVLNENHGILNRHHLLLEACTVNSVTEEDYGDLHGAGLGACLLSGLPDWATAYSARVVRFINLERKRLPEQIVKHTIKEKKKAGVEIFHDLEKSDSEIQAEGVYNQRLQSLAITLDKATYIMRKVYQDPRKAPPPLRKLGDEELVSFLWNGEQSLVEELLRCMSPYVDAERLSDLKHQISAHDPSGSQNVGKSLRESLLWLRDEVRQMPSSCRSRHDAAADLIHLYAYTQYFFSSRDYTPFQSPPLYIGPLDLGPKYANSLGSGFQEWQKTYTKDYALGQLIYWCTHTAADPGSRLTKARRGCLVLPDISSCYAKTPKQEFSRGYGAKEHAEMIRRMERQPQKPWPKGEFWEFRNNRGLFGSPMLDAVMNNSPLDKEMMLWLKNRPVVFDGPWDH